MLVRYNKVVLVQTPNRRNDLIRSPKGQFHFIINSFPQGAAFIPLRLY